MKRHTETLLLAAATLILLGLFWTSVWRGMDRSVLPRVPILDEAHYLQKAVAIRNDRWWPDEQFTMSPMYSYLVAVTGSGRLLDEHRVRVGPPTRGIRWLQALLWAGTAWLLWRVGRDLLGERWGWGPPLLWLGYGPGAILAGQVLMEIPLTFAATYALAMSGGHVGPASRTGRALVCGTLIGAAFLLRGTAIVLVVPVILALLPDRSQGSWRKWPTNALPVMVGLILIILPFVVLNSVRSRTLAPPALNGGVNLFIGNGPGATGFFRVFPGFDVETDPSGAAYLSAQEGTAIPDALTADRIWAAKARAAMAEDPPRVLGLWGRKVWLHFVGVEIPQISAPNAWLRHVPLLRVLIVPWALLAAGGLAGGILCWRRYPCLRLWLGSAALLIAVQSLFFVVTRYRLILVPMLALATVAVARELVMRRGRELAIALAVVALSAAAVWPWGLADTIRNFESGGLDNEAIRWEHLAASVTGTDPKASDDHLAEAEVLYRRSLMVANNRPVPWRGLARVSWVRGDRTRASDLLAEGLELIPGSQSMRLDLIRMLLLQDRLTEALPHLGLALGKDPLNAELLHSMTIALTSSGQLEDATIAASRLIAAHPADARGYLDLGTVLGRAGRLQEAGAVFADGLKQIPGHPELTRKLEQVRQMTAQE